MRDVFPYVIGLYACWWIHRLIKRTITGLENRTEVKNLDYRARAFVDVVQTAPYWTMIEYLQVGIGAAALYFGITLRVWWIALTAALVVYAAFAWLLQKKLFVHIYQFGHYTFIEPEMQRPSRLQSVRTIRSFAWWAILCSASSSTCPHGSFCTGPIQELSYTPPCGVPAILQGEGTAPHV
jgi:hypothetical protein